MMPNSFRPTPGWRSASLRNERSASPESPDYSKERSFCWFQLPKVRAFYPEYKDLTDDQLSEGLYAKADMPLTPIRPWALVRETAVIASGVPLSVLLVGWAMSC